MWRDYEGSGYYGNKTKVDSCSCFQLDVFLISWELMCYGLVAGKFVFGMHVRIGEIGGKSGIGGIKYGMDRSGVDS